MISSNEKILKDLVICALPNAMVDLINKAIKMKKRPGLRPDKVEFKVATGFLKKALANAVEDAKGRPIIAAGLGILSTNETGNYVIDSVESDLMMAACLHVNQIPAKKPPLARGFWPGKSEMSMFIEHVKNCQNTHLVIKK